MKKEEVVVELLRQAVEDGVIECLECGNQLEPDAEACYCGWKNLLLEEGLV